MDNIQVRIEEKIRPRWRLRVEFCLLGVAAYLIFCSAAAVAQQPKVKDLPFARGEELVYQAEFSRALLRGVDVAEFRFNSTSEHIARGADDPIILHLTGDVVSKGLFPRIAGFKFHQHIESTADAEPFTSLRTTRSEEQAKRVRQIEGVFDHQARKATWIERQPNQRTTSIDFTEPIQDVLTAIYFLRTQNLDAGKSFEVLLSDSGRVYRVPVNVSGSNFVNGAVGRVNGTDRATKFINANLVQVTLNAGDQLPPASLGIVVVNPTPGGGASNPLTFLVKPLHRLLLPLVRR